MEATSLILEANDFHPRSCQGVVSRVKCTPSTIVSVVNNSLTVLEPTFQAAVSSPLSTVSSNEKDRPFPASVRWSTTIRVSRSITPNSPNSLICIAHKLYNISWYSK